MIVHIYTLALIHVAKDQQVINATLFSIIIVKINGIFLSPPRDVIFREIIILKSESLSEWGESSAFVVASDNFIKQVKIHKQKRLISKLCSDRWMGWNKGCGASFIDPHIFIFVEINHTAIYSGSIHVSLIGLAEAVDLLFPHQTIYQEMQQYLILASQCWRQHPLSPAAQYPEQIFFSCSTA